MVVPVLRDRRGKFFLPMHPYDVTFSEGIRLLFGRLGQVGDPAIVRALEGDSDPPIVEGATRVAQAFVLVGVVPRLRALAELESTEAIRALGVIGHPDDFGSLIKLLDWTSHRVVFDALWALHDYRDYRAVPHAVRLASSRQMTVARGSVGILGELVTEEGIEEIRRLAGAPHRPLITEAAKAYLEHHLRLAGTTIESYAALSAPAKAIATIRLEKRYMDALEPGDVPMTHADAVAEVRQWIDAKSLSLHRMKKDRERCEAMSLLVGARSSIGAEPFQATTAETDSPVFTSQSASESPGQALPAARRTA